MLELRNISKRFASSLAVDDVSFRAGRGEVTGYLGPNGSGKSTTMKMIVGADTWVETSLPLLVSSIVMMAFAVLAGRLAFAMPRDLQSNWIFRVASNPDAAQLVSARRWALVIISLVPVCAIWAAALWWLWPWQAALVHLVALGLLGMMFVEVALAGALKIPCTCSYLPGKSHVSLVVCAAALVLLPLVMTAAAFEREALQDAFSYATMLGTLSVIWGGVRTGVAWGNASSTQATFDDEPAGAAVALELWDRRSSSIARPRWTIRNWYEPRGHSTPSCTTPQTVASR